MKLYISPFACSMAPQIALIEAGLKFEAIKLDNKTKTAGGVDFLKINPKGQVPTLVNDKDQVLTEGAAILQYIADLVPEKNLLPANGTWERYKAQECLNMIASEIHKGFSPLFAADRAFTGEAITQVKEVNKKRLSEKFNLLSEQMKNQKYILGNTFSVADAYLYTVLNWTGMVGIDLKEWPVLAEYHGHLASRPSVKAATEANTAAKRI